MHRGAFKARPGGPYAVYVHTDAYTQRAEQHDSRPFKNAAESSAARRERKSAVRLGNDNIEHTSRALSLRRDKAAVDSLSLSFLH